MLLSVILPVFNGVSYLERCVHQIIDNINNYTNYHIDLKFASNNANPDIKL